MKIRVKLSNPNSGSNMYKIFGARGKVWTIFAANIKQLREKIEAKMMLNQIKKNTGISKVIVDAINFTMEEFELDLNRKSKSGFRGIDSFV